MLIDGGEARLSCSLFTSAACESLHYRYEKFGVACLQLQPVKVYIIGMGNLVSRLMYNVDIEYIMYNVDIEYVTSLSLRGEPASQDDTEG